MKRYQTTGNVKRLQKPNNGYETIYTRADIYCLAKLDQRHEAPNGYMVKKLCERAYIKYEDKTYERLSHISVSHIYNMRHKETYVNCRVKYEKTKRTKGVAIGTRKKPRPDDRPGFIRIDTVHQGYHDGVKGVYHINAVDEVTQFEVVMSVEKISEVYLEPILKLLLSAFPFKIINFHSDNGSEYVNKTVAALLDKLLIEFTKSRPRHSNDNGLAEGKNAAIVRKVFGRCHIPQKWAERINIFNIEALYPYVNFHRPCLFPRKVTDENGKIKMKYEYKNMMTPYEKFRSLANAEQFLKEGESFEELDKIEMKMSDDEAADLLQREKSELFKLIFAK